MMPEKAGIRGNFVLDECIIEGGEPILSLAGPVFVQVFAKYLCLALPKEVSRVVKADSYGTSAWNRTARITTELGDRTERNFFVKVF